MHLDKLERPRGMSAVADLLDEGGCLIMSLRHGPIPTGRRVFDVTAAETICLAEAHDLDLVLNVCGDSAQSGNRGIGVTWTRPGFRKQARMRIAPLTRRVVARTARPDCSENVRCPPGSSG
jgi:hypothetical protein